MTNITYRLATFDDSYTVFKLFEETLADLSRRLGFTQPTSFSDPAALERMWQERRSLYEHLARTADQFWLAERAGQAVGFARSIVRDGCRELTEFFVLPGQQSAGIGQELLARAFPQEGAKQRSIISSPDIRAQALYLKAGVYPRFPIYYFWRTPETIALDSNLNFERVSTSAENLQLLAEVDRAVIGYRRDTDHTWLLNDRQGYFYYRRGQLVGYGYVGLKNGPFALLGPHDFPAVLAHAESQAAASGRDHFGLEVPMINRTAIDYLLARRCRIESFTALFMSDAPFGQFEHYIVTSPPFFL